MDTGTQQQRRLAQFDCVRGEMCSGGYQACERMVALGDASEGAVVGTLFDRWRRKTPVGKFIDWVQGGDG